MTRYPFIQFKPLINGFVHNEDRVYLWLGLLLTIASLSIIWLNKYPPLQDYPFHLVRIHMILHFSDKAFGFSDRATLSLFPTPYILADYLSLAFGSIFSLLTTGKLVLSTYIISMAYSIFYLARAVHPKNTPYFLFAFLFIFNLFFNMGFISFIFSIPFFMLAFGYWWKHRMHLTPVSLAILAGLILGVYLSHPFSFCFLFLVLFLLSIYFFQDNKKIFIGLLSFLPSVLLLLAALSRDLSTTGEINQYVAFFIQNPIGKLLMAFGKDLPYFTSFKPKYESILLAIAGLVILATFIIQLRTCSNKRGRNGILLAVSALLGTYLFLPDDFLLPSLSYVANRALIFLALLSIFLPEAPSRAPLRLSIALFATALALSHISLMFLAYKTINKESADISSAFNNIPDNARIVYWSKWSLSRYGNIYPNALFDGYYYAEHAGPNIPTLTAFAGPLRSLQFKDQSNRNRKLEDVFSEGCAQAGQGGYLVLYSRINPLSAGIRPEDFGCTVSFAFGRITMYRALPNDGKISKNSAQTDPMSRLNDSYFKQEGDFKQNHDYLILYGPQKDVDTLQNTGCYEPVFTRNNAHVLKHISACII